MCALTVVQSWKTYAQVESWRDVGPPSPGATFIRCQTPPVESPEEPEETRSEIGWKPDHAPFAPRNIYFQTQVKKLLENEDHDRTLPSPPPGQLLLSPASWMHES